MLDSSNEDSTYIHARPFNRGQDSFIAHKGSHFSSSSQPYQISQSQAFLSLCYYSSLNGSLGHLASPLTPKSNLQRRQPKRVQKAEESKNKTKFCFTLNSFITSTR